MLSDAQAVSMGWEWSLNCWKKPKSSIVSTQIRVKVCRRSFSAIRNNPEWQLFRLFFFVKIQRISDLMMWWHQQFLFTVSHKISSREKNWMLIEHYITFTEELKSFFHSIFSVKNLPKPQTSKAILALLSVSAIQLELVWANKKLIHSCSNC